MNIFHSIATFFFFHWVKGSPIEASNPDPFHPQGKYDKLTFWEQIDIDMQWTPTKKFLISMPIAILFICAYTSYNNMLLNVFFAAPVIIAKLPQLYKKRLFGINA